MKTQANTVGSGNHAKRKDIYVIKNRINDKVYVGQSINAAARFESHCKKRSDERSLIDSAIQKYGRENFWFEIIEPQVENYNERERYWIDHYKSLKPNGYNIQSGGEDPPVYRSYGHPTAIFNTEDEVDDIKDLLRNSSLSLSEIGKRCGISKRTVMRINQGIVYEKSDETYPIRKIPLLAGKLSDEQVEEIIEILNNTYRQYEDIAEQYGISISAVKQINSGDCHPLDGVIYPIRRYKNSGRPACTYAQVTEIHDLLKNSNMSCGQIAEKYNIDLQTVYFINHGSAKRYLRDGYTYPIRVLRARTEPVSTISAKESTSAIDTPVERGAPCA